MNWARYKTYNEYKEEYDKQLDKDRNERIHYTRFELESYKKYLTTCYYCKNFIPTTDYNNIRCICLRPYGFCKKGMWKNKWIGCGEKVIKNINEYKEGEYVELLGAVIEVIKPLYKPEYFRCREYGVDSSDVCDLFEYDKDLFGKKVYEPYWEVYMQPKEYAKILELSETTVRNYLKGIPKKYNYEDNSGRWSASYNYYTYSIDDVLNYLKENRPQHYIKLKAIYEEQYSIFLEKYQKYNNMMLELCKENK